MKFMTHKRYKILLVLGVLFCLAKTFGQNPIIQTRYTADPAPMVYHDTVFLYTSHDQPDAVGFKMTDWLLYTSTDMVNWTDRGTVASLKDFKWAGKNGAWAPQVIRRNGKFYMYCPIHLGGIGVLISNSPYGPFIDAIGKPIINNSPDDIDPTVFIDEDGQAYLYWGNPDLNYVKLNPDMISYTGSVHKIQKRITDYQEGPWFYKRKGHYYLAFASSCCPEGIGYAMSDKPTGPWVYKGAIMDHNPLSNGNHPGIIDYKGKSYVFGFDYALLKQTTTQHFERRSVCLDEMHYNEDGTIQQLPFWSEAGPAPAGALNPFIWQEAETIAWSKNIGTASSPQTGMYVTDIENGSYIKLRNVDFQKGCRRFEARVASAAGGTIELRLDSLTGKLIGKCNIINTGGPLKWKTSACKLTSVSGKHDLFFIFKGAKAAAGNKRTLFNFDKWRFQ
ncbi:glycoside hydrolase family 43 protein [Arachidicoccus ginsenosidivorans]